MRVVVGEVNMEFQLIERLKSSALNNKHVTVGIGDDCAILPLNDQFDQLVTTDLLLDGVHFIYDADPENSHSLMLIARKAIAVNVSDIAAMGGKPTVAFLSLAIPRNWTLDQINELGDRLVEQALHFDVILAGGDTTSWDNLLAINITMLGEVPKGEAIRRNTAQPGDIICVSGPLGGSIAGKHLEFIPQIKQAIWMRSHCKINSMIDISDGLLADLHHILKQSQVGAELIESQIPITPEAMNFTDEKTPLEHALSDGEDFELLWTISDAQFQKLMQNKTEEINVFPIGKITETPGCFLINSKGDKEPAQPEGYTHRVSSQ